MIFFAIMKIFIQYVSYRGTAHEKNQIFTVDSIGRPMGNDGDTRQGRRQYLRPNAEKANIFACNIFGLKCCLHP